MAEQERCREVAYVTSWLIEQLPELWHDKPMPQIRRVAEWIIALRAKDAAGAWGAG